MRRGLFDIFALVWAVAVTAFFVASYVAPHAVGKL